MHPRRRLPPLALASDGQHNVFINFQLRRTFSSTVIGSRYGHPSAHVADVAVVIHGSMWSLDLIAFSVSDLRRPVRIWRTYLYFLITLGVFLYVVTPPL
jgi:hypothetical protein